MYSHIKKILYISLITLFFLFLNIGDSYQVFANEETSNPLNYEVTINNAIKDQTSGGYYTSSNQLDLTFDSRIISNNDIEHIMILEYEHGNDSLVITRGDPNFKSNFTYNLKNSKSELKELTIVLLGSENDGEYYVVLAKIILTIRQYDPLNESSFYLRSGDTPDEQGRYTLQIDYDTNKDFHINSINYYLDPDESNLINVSENLTSFQVVDGYYYVIIEDIFGNTVKKGVLVGYGRIDSVTISTEDELTKRLGVVDSITFSLDIFAAGESVLDNMPSDLVVEWVISGYSYVGTLRDGLATFKYDIPNDITLLGTHEVQAIVGEGNRKFSNILIIEVINNAAPNITMLGDATITLEARVNDYVELGATASDDIDGNITRNIIIDFSSFRIPGLTSVVYGDILDGNRDVLDKLSLLNDTIGSYRVTYRVRDQHNNYSRILTRRVNVVDTMEPVITLNGPSLIRLEYGNPYEEHGASAIDIYDGVIPVIIDATSLRINEVGTYEIRYSATDSSGNIGRATRVVIVGDNVPPVVEVNPIDNSEDYIELNYKERYIEKGAQFSDNVDGVFNIEPSSFLFLSYYDYEDYDLGLIDYTYVSFVDTAKLGTYLVNYSRTDSSGNESNIATRTVKVMDKTPPRITLVGNRVQLIIHSVQNNPYEQYDPGVIVSDNYHSDVENEYYMDLGDYVVRTYYRDGNNIDSSFTRTQGSYEVRYEVSDTSGNTSSVTRIVIVDDPTSEPLIDLKGFMSVNYEVFSSVNPLDYYEDGEYGFKVNHTAEASVLVDIYKVVNGYDELLQKGVIPDYIYNYIDTDYINTYKLVYYAIDDFNGNETPLNYRPERIVNVVDTTAPIITTTKSVYTKPLRRTNLNELINEIRSNLTISDNYDDLRYLDPIEPVIIEYIRIDTVGSYNVIINATDRAGNAALPLTIRVEIFDDEAPVITIIGEEVIYHERGMQYLDQFATAYDHGDGQIVINQLCEGDFDSIENSGYFACFSYSPPYLDGMRKGTFVVTYYVRDSSGNKATATRTVHVIDTIAPTISGLEEDRSAYNHDLIIYFGPTPGTDEVVSATLNGRTYYSGEVILAERNYELTVVDDFGNKTTVNFRIDKTPPVITNIQNGQHFNTSITQVVASEPIDIVEYQINNSDWYSIPRSEAVFIDEGRYQIRVRDLSGNWSSVINFTIDKTLPLYLLTPGVNKRVSEENVYLDLLESNLEVIVNNVRYTEADLIEPFSVNGYYRIRITDRAGNFVLLQFVIIKPGSVVTIDEREINNYEALDIVNNRIRIDKGVYEAGSGIVITYPKTDGTFELVTVHRFSDKELEYLLNNDHTIITSINTSNVMGVAFLVDAETLSLFATTSEEGGLAPYIIGASIALLLILIFFVVRRGRKDDDEYYLETDDTVTQIEDIEY